MIFLNDSSDPETTFFNVQLQKIESPYFPASDLNVIASKLNKDSFSILHLSFRSLTKNIENFKHLLGSVNGMFSVIVVTEIWC